MLQYAAKINDQEVLDQLKKYDKNAPDFISADYLMTSREVMNRYGIGMTHQNYSMFKMLKDIMLIFKGYTLSEKINYGRGNLFSLQLFYQTFHDNLFETSVSFEVPVYITQGKNDHVTKIPMKSERMSQLYNFLKNSDSTFASNF